MIELGNSATGLYAPDNARATSCLCKADAQELQMVVLNIWSQCGASAIHLRYTDTLIDS